jgi:zinc transport system substrate-binding protein
MAVRGGMVWLLVGLLAVPGLASATPSRLTIVTSFYPVYLATLNVARGVPGVSVVNLTGPQTGCLHDYQLTPSDLKKLEQASLFVVNGAGMESFLDKVIKRLPGLKIVEASRGIPLLKNASDGEENPHVWVSITNAIQQVRNIGEQLAGLDPTHAKQYRANAGRYVRKLEALRQKMHQALAGLRHREMVTFHEAFPYFAKEFNLRVVAVIEREPGSEPSARDLAQTIELVKRTKSKVLFTEPQYSAKAAAVIARETKARLYTLDPVVTGPADPDAYLHIMEQNLKTLQEALR